jgi:hypothetical protein
MSAVRPPPKNDYTPPAPLPGSLRRPAAPSASAAAAAAQASIDPAEYLEKAEGEWNERVDKEIGGLAGGLESLVKSFGVVRLTLPSFSGGTAAGTCPPTPVAPVLRQ